MNKDVYSNSELTELKNRINKEMLRRGSYKWWGPLSQPKVGEDTRSPDSIPHDKTSIPITDQTYTINNPSVGSIAPTRNIVYPNQGENPAGQNPDGQTPTTSAARFDLDEIKNFLVGISKIRDINLFYSQDEQEFLAFRDLDDVRKLVGEIESDRLNEPTTHPSKVDPNAPDRITVIKDGKTWTEPNPNKNIPYQKIGDKYYMPSGEMDGEEGIPSETNYYDDYGAEPGNGNYHSLNPYVSAKVDRTGYDFDNDRNKIPVGRMEGGKSSSRFGMTPRNPQQGDSYSPRVAYQGVPSTCNIACSGVCSLTCDSQCGESCTTTCFGRCGNACSSSCGNVCTGCSSLCYTSCQSKCENNTGFACVKSGATTLSIAARGGKDGTPAYNEMKVGAPYACTQCSFSCQFYPNKKTTCWDNGCMGMCFTSCMHSCSTSCFGGCVDNPSENKGDYKTGIGRGCSSGCTVNCIGVCRGTCTGSCDSGCWNSCIESCKDNCEWECSTSCGSGCMTGCTSGCKDECNSCTNTCTAASGAKTTCNNGCVAYCMQGCNKNCVSNGCMAMCGSEGTDACDMNCRMNCMAASCTSRCSEKCTTYCTSCINTCGFGCGACFKAGTLIETINGPIPIEEVQIGDLVLTKSGKYHKVYNIMKRSPDIKDLLVVKGVGTFDIYTTIDHPFWVRKYIGLGKDKEFGTTQVYGEAEWVEAKDINSRDKICLHTPPIGNVNVNPGVAYMLGRWLGDGCRVEEISNINNKPYPRFTICCGKHERVDFERKLRQAAIYTTKHEGETTFVYRIPGKITKHTADYNNYELVELLKKCGRRAEGKLIPQEVFNWDEISLSYMIQGYIDADGHISKLTSQFSMTSINKKLLYQFATLLRMLDRNPSCVERKFVSDVGYIQGRKVHIHKSYMLRSQFDEFIRYYSIHDYQKNITWSTFRAKHSPTERYDVYNLSVEEDPTYYADGVLVHNCSSLCNTGCEAACNITCTAHCQHSCDLNCVKSCTEACGGCSQLCTSCVGMCIGECSVKCTNNCSLCANNCGHWCDTKCSQNCFANCDNSCMQTCTNSCIGTVTSNSKQPLAGPERPPTAHGYKTPHPSNREEERESFRLLHDINQITTDRIIRDWKERLKKKSPYSTVPDTKICIKVKSNDNIKVIFTDCDPVPYNIYYSTVTGGVFNIDEKTGTILINHKALEEWAKSGYKKVIKNVNQKDGEDVSIVAVVLHCKDTNLTVDDVSYMRPLGYDFYTPYHTKNGDIICILQYLINYMEYDKNKHPDDQHITYPKRL